MATGLTVRQLVEGMTLTFDPEKAGDLRATLQWVVNGDEPGEYHLVVGDGRCTFVPGTHPDPTLRITTPSDVWAAIVAGEKDGAEALMAGEWQVSGSDPALALRIKEIFRPRDEVVLEVDEKVPGGPVALAPPLWILVSFVPWVLAWVLVPGLDNRLALGIAGGVAAAVAFVRQQAGTVTLNELLTPVAMLGLGAVVAADPVGFETTGPALISLALAAVWGASLVPDALSGLGEYSRWGYVPGMAAVGQFRHTNGAITAMWALLFLLGGIAGLLAVDAEGAAHAVALAVQYGVVPGALVVARLYQKDAATRRLERLDAELSTQRSVGAGVAVAAGLAMVAGVVAG